MSNPRLSNNSSALYIQITLQVLKTMTSNVQTPYLVWDNGTRAQLLDFLQENQQKHIKTGESDPSYGADFLFEAHKDELVIGGVFIRVYNEQPNFPIEARLLLSWFSEILLNRKDFGVSECPVREIKIFLQKKYQLIFGLFLKSF